MRGAHKPEDCKREDRREDRDDGCETEQRIAAGIHCHTCRLWAVGFRLWSRGAKSLRKPKVQSLKPAAFIDKTPDTNPAHQGQSSLRERRRARGRCRTAARISIRLVATR